MPLVVYCIEAFVLKIPPYPPLPKWGYKKTPPSRGRVRERPISGLKKKPLKGA